MPGHCADIAPHLAAADAYVLSSDYEGLAAVLIEALAAGVPVVATNCSVNMGWLLDGVGTLVPVGDRAALAGAMQGGDRGSAASRCAALRARAATFTVDASAGAMAGASGGAGRARLDRPVRRLTGARSRARHRGVLKMPYWLPRGRRPPTIGTAYLC